MYSNHDFCIMINLLFEVLPVSLLGSIVYPKLGYFFICLGGEKLHDLRLSVLPFVQFFKIKG